MTPAVTVLMPVYNGRRFIRRAIESVRAQTLPDFELLVVDDGSTDGSGEIARSFADRRIRVLRLPENRGRVAATNAGLREAVAPFVARLDADDMARPERLERQVAFLMRYPSAAAVGSWTALINENDRHFMTSRFPSAPGEIYGKLLSESCFNHSCMTFRRAAVDAVGGYRDSHGGLAEDYDLYLRLAERFELANLPEVLGCYRVHPGQVSQSSYARQRHAGNAIRYAAALERHRLGRLGDPEAFAPPGLLAQLRGYANTPGADCIVWSQVYRSMPASGSAMIFALHACARSPLTTASWKALWFALVGLTVPRSIRRGMAWYALRLREAAGKRSSPPRDRVV